MKEFLITMHGRGTAKQIIVDLVQVLQVLENEKHITKAKFASIEGLAVQTLIVEKPKK